MIGRLGTSLLAKEAKVETKREGEILYLSKTRQSGLLEDPQQSISRAACLNPRQQGSATFTIYRHFREFEQVGRLVKRKGKSRIISTYWANDSYSKPHFDGVAIARMVSDGPLLVSSDNRASGGRSGNTPGAFQCLTEGYVRTVRVVCVDSALTILRVDLGTLLQLIVRAPCLDQPAHFPIRSRLRSVEGVERGIGFSVDMEDIGEGPCSDKR
uniref:Uncharacterized protein n=1 Tax=Vespula pensylvanica TaxID=30213 RepID=A0A834PF84_VESPE|nr:hypothetical protein H0235_000988 [Vespula pensylvanica]